MRLVISWLLLTCVASAQSGVTASGVSISGVSGSTSGATFAAGLTDMGSTSKLSTSSACATSASPVPALTATGCSFSSTNPPCTTGTSHFNSATFNGCPSVMGDWSGGFTDNANNGIVPWGGGHGDYGGNEMYEVKVTGGDQSVHRIYGPDRGIGECSNFSSTAGSIERYPPVTPTGVCTDPGQGNGTGPASRHSYGAITTIPDNGGGQYTFVYAGSLAGGPGTTGLIGWVYNWSNSTWKELSGVTFTNNIGPDYSFAQADPSTTSTSAKVVAWYNNALYRTSIDLTTIGNSTVTASAALFGTEPPSRVGYGQISWVNNTMVWLWQDTMGGYFLYKQDVSSSGNTWVDITGSIVDGTASCKAHMFADYADMVSMSWPGAQPTSTGVAIQGMTYNYVDQKIYTYFGGNDRPTGFASIYSFDAVTNTCVEFSIAGLPDKIKTLGTWGRLNNIPGKQWLMLWADYDSDVYVICPKNSGTCAQ